MKTFQAEVMISDSRQMTIELPEGFETGSYQVVVVMNPSSGRHEQGKAAHALNAAAGKVQAFKDFDAVDWQRQERSAWEDA